MATTPKIWRKLNGQWVKTTPDVSKDDVGLGNVENFTHTNSATDGSSSKYATGAAVKQAYDRGSEALSLVGGKTRLGKEQVINEKGSVVEMLYKVPAGCVVTRARRGEYSTFSKVYYRKIS